MDSFTLRQEISALTKDWQELSHKLEAGDKRIKELHDEEMRYLNEIPLYKKQADDYKLQAMDAVSKATAIKADTEKLRKDLEVLRGLSAVESKSLMELKETQKKIIEETKQINEQIKSRHEQLKQREIFVVDKEKNLELREIGIANRESEQTKNEVELNNIRNKYNTDNENLRANIQDHINNIAKHNEKVDIFLQTKELHLSDEKLLEGKSQKLEKMIKENADLKASLLLQSEKLSQEIKLTQNKQSSLDRSLADLVNQENALKIKELRVTKLIRDNGIAKELKDLEESLK
jgi:hypothetical protein